MDLCKSCDVKQILQVREVITVVEKELGFGEGKLLHKLCKVVLHNLSSVVYGNLCSTFVLHGNK